MESKTKTEEEDEDKLPENDPNTPRKTEPSPELAWPKFAEHIAQDDPAYLFFPILATDSSIDPDRFYPRTREEFIVSGFCKVFGILCAAAFVAAMVYEYITIGPTHISCPVWYGRVCNG